MTSHDLKHLLQTVADQGTETYARDEDQLVPRIRRRRRRRSAVSGIASLTTAAVIAVSAYAVLPGAGTSRTVANGGDDGQTTVAATPPPPLKCGASLPMGLPAGLPEGLKGLRLTQQTMERGSTGWTGTVQVRVTNTRSFEQINGVTEFAVVQKNRVVGQAVLNVADKPVTVQSGQHHTSQARIDLRTCDRTPGAQLPAGSYQLYGKLVALPTPEVHVARKLNAESGETARYTPIAAVQLDIRLP